MKCTDLEDKFRESKASKVPIQKVESLSLGTVLLKYTYGTDALHSIDCAKCARDPGV